MQDDEEKILNLIDGKKTIQMVLEESGLEATQGLKSIFGLLILEKVSQGLDPVQREKSKNTLSNTQTQGNAMKETSGPTLFTPEKAEKIQLDSLNNKSDDPYSEMMDQEKQEISLPPSFASENLVASSNKKGKDSDGSSTPVILGDVKSLEKDYETKRRLRQKSSKFKTKKKESEITLEPVSFKENNKLTPKNIREENLSSVNKSTPDWSNSPELEEMTMDSLPPQDNISPEETNPPKEQEKTIKFVDQTKTHEQPLPSTQPPSPEPVQSKTPPDRETVAVGISALEAIPMGAKVKFVGMGVGFCIFIISIVGFFIWRNPQTGITFLEQMRLQKMYGKISLDERVLAKFYTDDGQLQKAEKTFQNVLKKTPRQESVQLELAQVQWKMGKRNAACDQYKTLDAQNPALADAHLGLAWCYMHDGEVTRAKREFYLYLSMAPITPQTQAIRQIVNSFR